MLPVDAPFRQYFDIDGKPLDGGYIYFGQPNENPETSPITVYWDAEGTQPADQPVRTLNGYPVRGGAPATLLAGETYSLTVKNNRKMLVRYAPISHELDANSLLKSELAASSGASLIGFKQNGDSAENRTVEDKARDIVSIRDFGGADDWDGSSGTDNTIAFSKIKADYPGGCIVHFPRKGTGVYRFGTIPADYFSGYVLAHDGINFRIANSLAIAQQNMTVTRDIEIFYEDMGGRYTYSKDSGNTSNFHQRKTQFLGPGDLDHTEIALEAASSARNELLEMAWPDGPFVTRSSGADGFAINGDSDFTVTLPAGNGLVKLINFPAIPGTEVSMWFAPEAGFDGSGFAGVTTEDGYDCYYENLADAAGGGGRMQKQFADGSGVYHNVGIAFEQSSSHASYWMRSSLVTVRVISATSFVVLVNGVVRMLVRQTRAPIRGVFFGAGFGTGNYNVAMLDFVRIKNKKTFGQKAIRVLALGDSITDENVHGNWPQYMASALEGCMGVRVRELRNLAVGGHNAGDQAALLNSTTMANIDVAVVMVGVNDQQIGNSLGSFGAWITNILSTLNGAGIPVVIGLPTMYYSRALASAQTGYATQGADTANYEFGGKYKGTVQRLVASTTNSMNRVLHTVEAMGPVLAQWLAEDIDPIMTDNIHPTTYGRKLLGFSFARAVAGLLSPAVKRRYTPTLFGDAFGQNDWTANGAGYEIDEAGHVSLYGSLKKNAGAATDGTVIGQLPKHLWPNRAKSFSCPTLTSGFVFTTSPCTLQLGTDGKLTLHAAPAMEYVYLGPVQYGLGW